MNPKKLLSLFGLKWNPFIPGIPTEALFSTPAIESFCARVEGMTREGGFALVTGPPGIGKSVTLRILAHRLALLPEITVGVLTRPQSGLADFYREMGEVFGVELSPHNRWGGFKVLREKWKAFADTSLFKPVLIVDEAQETPACVLSELRVLIAGAFDVDTYLTVVLAGDNRLVDHFRKPELLPLGSRIRTRLVLDYSSKEELLQILQFALKEAGNSNLLGKNLMYTLVDHAGGNCRVLMTMAGELLMAACEREITQIDEKLFFEVFESRAPRGKRKTKTKGSRG